MGLFMGRHEAHTCCINKENRQDIMENVIRALSAPGVRDEVGCPLRRSGQMQQASRIGERISPLPGFFQVDEMGTRQALDVPRETHDGSDDPTCSHVIFGNLERTSSSGGLEQQIRWCPRIAHDEDEHEHERGTRIWGTGGPAVHSSSRITVHHVHRCFKYRSRILSHQPEYGTDSKRLFMGSSLRGKISVATLD